MKDRTVLQQLLYDWFENRVTAIDDRWERVVCYERNVLYEERTRRIVSLTISRLDFASIRNVRVNIIFFPTLTFRLFVPRKRIYIRNLSSIAMESFDK